MKPLSFFTPRSFALPLTFAAFVIAQALSARAFDALSALLLEIWGITPKTLPYAPVWLQTAVASYSPLRSLCTGAAGFTAILLCTRYLLHRPCRIRPMHIAHGAGIGICLSALAFAVLLPTDSVRTMKTAGVYLPAELISFSGAVFSALSAESLLGGALWQTLRLKKTWLKRLLFILLGALMYSLSAPWSFSALMSVSAMSALCVFLYERRSFWAAAAVRCFWAFGAHRLFGFSAFSTGSTPGIFFETYPVSRDWLTGGDLGLESGLLCAVLFAAAAFIVYKFFKNPVSEE